MQGFAGWISINPCAIILSEPKGPIEIKLTVYVPKFVYVWDGLNEVLVFPSPKSQ